MIIRNLFEHKPRVYYGSVREVNAFATVKVDRRHILSVGDHVYVIKVHGDRIELHKLDEQGNPDTSVLYVDCKQKYVLP